MTRLRPQDLVFTLFGEYLLPRAEPVWVGHLIALLEPLGLSEGAVRTILSRMTRKGWFRTVREGRRSFYELTPKGRRLLEEGRERVYHPSWDEPWDGKWTVVGYSIPEDLRGLRDRLRDRLAWLGFGPVGSGLWISPRQVEEQVRDIATAMGLEDHLACFRGEGAAFSDPERLVARGWDLAGINQDYEAFVARYVSPFKRLRAAVEEGAPDPRECYVSRFQLSHEFRHFPLVDPFLPRSLLPDGWAGECAAVLFQTYHDLLTEPADRYVDSVLNGAADLSGPEAAEGHATTIRAGHSRATR